MSEASVDVSKASRSGSSHSESSQDLINDEENETPYVAASPEELGEVTEIDFSASIKYFFCLARKCCSN